MRKIQKDSSCELSFFSHHFKLTIRDMKVVARIIDSKPKKDRRFRNILANSGKVMESGEIRSLDDMYVMGYDAKLYKISELEREARNG